MRRYRSILKVFVFLVVLLITGVVFASTSFSPYSNTSWQRESITVSFTVSVPWYQTIGEVRSGLSPFRSVQSWNNYNPGVKVSLFTKSYSNSLTVGNSERYVHVLYGSARSYNGYASGIHRSDYTDPHVYADPTHRNPSSIFVKETHSDIVARVTAQDTISGLRTLQYSWHADGADPSNWHSISASGRDAGGNAVQTQVGTWYLTIKATDIAGNQAERTFGPYVKTASSGGDTSPPDSPPGGGASPQPSAPSVTANPPNRAWSQADVSVLLSFANTTSQRARWSSGSWTSSSSSSSRTMTINDSGSWTLYVEASGPGGSVSPSFGLYRIDKEPPTIMFTPLSGGFIDAGTVGIRFRDEHSGIRRVRWVWSQSGDTHPDWSWVSRSGNTVNEAVQLPGYGVWWVHAEVEDNVGLTSYAVGGPYLVINELKLPPYRRWVRLVE